jgi:hypothetical protein
MSRRERPYYKFKFLDDFHKEPEENEEEENEEEETSK